MYGNDPKKVNHNNREFQEAASQRKASNDTQYFWDLVKRHMSGHSIPISKRMNKSQEENHLFAKKIESATAGVIDDSIPVQRSGPRSEEISVLEKFEDLGNSVPGSILRCVTLLRYDRPTPIQKHAIPLGLAGLDLMCCAQTGSGKTIAFLIPVVTALDVTIPRPNFASDRGAEVVSIDQRGVLPRAVVLAPTRELASQIQMDARRLTFGSNIKSVCVYGGNDIRSQLQELCTGCELIVATPGRLNDLVSRGCVSLSQVSFLVLDEADRMLDMGFEPQIRQIVSDYDMPCGEQRQTFMFSATFPNEIQTLAREFLRNYVWIAVGRVGSTVDNIKQQVLQATSDPYKKLELLLGVLDQTDGRTLIFVQKKRTASWLCDCLRSMHRITAEEIHGDRSQAQREHALRMFRDGNIRILIATDVAARGLDVPAVKHVIQFDMPLSSDDFDVYVHRIGRTGRAGMSGLATCFFVPGREVGEGNGKIAQQLLQLLQENNQEVPEWFLQLDDLYSGGGGGFHHRRTPYGNSGGGYPRGGARFGYQDNRTNTHNSYYQGGGNNYIDRQSSHGAPRGQRFQQYGYQQQQQQQQFQQPGRYAQQPGGEYYSQSVPNYSNVDNSGVPQNQVPAAQYGGVPATTSTNFAPANPAGYYEYANSYGPEAVETPVAQAPLPIPAVAPAYSDISTVPPSVPNVEQVTAQFANMSVPPVAQQQGWVVSPPTHINPTYPDGGDRRYGGGYGGAYGNYGGRGGGGYQPRGYPQQNYAGGGYNSGYGGRGRGYGGAPRGSYAPRSDDYGQSNGYQAQTPANYYGVSQGGYGAQQGYRAPQQPYQQQPYQQQQQQYSAYARQQYYQTQGTDEGSYDYQQPQYGASNAEYGNSNSVAPEAGGDTA